MKHWRQAALGAYYHATLPWRRFRNARAAAAGRAPVFVLAYHRVSDEQPNEWTIDPRTFVAHLRWLRRHFELVSLDEIQRRIESPANDRAAVAITFDDGYADNCDLAIPILIQWRIPCTYFVCTDSVLRGVPFDHDVRRGTPRHPNTVEQLQSLVRAGIALGAHTRTHSNLGQIHDSERLYDEVVGARDELEAAVGTAIRYFAFPFGQHANLNRDVFTLAHQAGYQGVCSAYGGYAVPGDDAFHLQRMCADGPLISLKNFITLDPRKPWPKWRYDYGRTLSPPRPAEVARA